MAVASRCEEVSTRLGCPMRSETMLVFLRRVLSGFGARLRYREIPSGSSSSSSSSSSESVPERITRMGLTEPRTGICLCGAVGGVRSDVSSDRTAGDAAPCN